MSRNILNIIGLGPGDPELITLKAFKLLNESDIIFYPSVLSGKNKFAYDTILKALSSGENFTIKKEKFIPLEVEMRLSTGKNNELYRENARKVINAIRSDLKCSYITIGDPMFYSTFWGLYNAIQKEIYIISNKNEAFSPENIKIEISNGISSFNYALGLIGTPFVIKNSSVFVSVPLGKDIAEIKKEIDFMSGDAHGSDPNVILFMKSGSMVADLVNIFKNHYAEMFKENRLKLFFIEKSVLLKDFIDHKMEINKSYGRSFDYFSILVGVFL